MKSLVWREYRLNALILIAGAALLLLPYLFTAVAVLWRGEISRHDMLQFFALAAAASLWLSQLTVAFLGGNAFAGERADRSAEFMAYLPISRQRRLASKLILAAAVIALIWVTNVAVLASLHEFSPRVFLEALRHAAATGFVMFGVGWLVSAFQSSPTFAVCAGIATPMVTLIGLWTAFSVAEDIAPELVSSLDSGTTIETTFLAVSLTLGTVGFAFGTWLYLNRVEP